MKCYMENMEHITDNCVGCRTETKAEYHVDYDGTCILLCGDCVEKWKRNGHNMCVVSIIEMKKEAAKDRETEKCLYYNITFIIPEDRKDDLIEKLHYVETFVGGTMSVVAGEPVKYIAKRCPQCHNLIHYMCQECSHCGENGIK